jgi:hypothetical protein
MMMIYFSLNKLISYFNSSISCVFCWFLISNFFFLVYLFGSYSLS